MTSVAGHRFADPELARLARISVDLRARMAGGAVKAAEGAQLLSGGSGSSPAVIRQTGPDTNGRYSDYINTSAAFDWAETPLSGSLLVALTVNTSGTCTTPEGWTLEETVADQGGSSSVGIYTRTAGASEPTSVTWDWSNADYHGCVMFEVTGSSHGIDQLAYGSNETAPNLTNTKSSELTVNFWTQNAGSGLTGPSSPWTNLASQTDSYHQLVSAWSNESGAGGSVTGGANGALTTVALSIY